MFNISAHEGLADLQIFDHPPLSGKPTMGIKQVITKSITLPDLYDNSLVSNKSGRGGL